MQLNSKQHIKLTLKYRNKVFLEQVVNGNGSGWIEVVTGSMFSGKTEELLRRLRRATFARQKVVLFKPALDNRYSETEVVSHDSTSLAATVVYDSLEMLHLSKDAQVIGIDEAQFFDDSLVDICQKLANEGKRIIIAGLDMDYRGVPFGIMPKLMAIAEFVDKVHAICVRCGRLAQYSHRTIKQNDLVVLGEKDRYEPLCRRCYQMFNNNNESEHL
ncbi:MAG: thymidine kinase [Bacteroidales bacterium]|nr:thymidine kinase [Bacteroidales bacterium]